MISAVISFLCSLLMKKKVIVAVFFATEQNRKERDANKKSFKVAN
jgi:hypothetical protein